MKDNFMEMAEETAEEYQQDVLRQAQQKGGLLTSKMQQQRAQAELERIAFQNGKW